MIQTGDPTGTGKGGQSIWGRPFPDEVRGTLKVRVLSPGSRRLLRFVTALVGLAECGKAGVTALFDTVYFA